MWLGIALDVSYHSIPPTAALKERQIRSMSQMARRVPHGTNGTARWFATPTFRRLSPLYLTAILLGFALWYPVEKLFMHQIIGFNDGQIGIAVAICAVAMLIVEVPSGIAADIFGYKPVYMVGCVMLALSGLVSGLSHTIPVYMVGMVCWAIYMAAVSGTDESLIFEVVKEEEGGKIGSYKQYLRFYRIINSVSLTLGSLAGGVISTVFGIRTAYILGFPVALGALVPLAIFRDVKRKSENNPEIVVEQATRELTGTFATLKAQWAATRGAVFGNRQLLFIVIAMVATEVAIRTLEGFNQLWLIALLAPAVLYGPFNALLLLSEAAGGVLVKLVSHDTYRTIVIVLVFLLLSSAGLAIVENIAGVFVCTAVLGTLLYTVKIHFTTVLHEDHLQSEVRAGAASIVSTLPRGCFIAISLVFGYISHGAGIFVAAWVLFAVVAVISGSTFRTLRKGAKLQTIVHAALSDP
jgi:MFS family permease